MVVFFVSGGGFREVLQTFAEALDVFQLLLFDCGFAIVVLQLSLCNCRFAIVVLKLPFRSCRLQLSCCNCSCQIQEVRPTRRKVQEVLTDEKSKKS